ncbi:MAG TPA: Flp family type IVb pilin [Acidimicrobiales bacterium]|nr:Flp family type IVb pilin [Acidimicrobiales bacterium]
MNLVSYHQQFVAPYVRARWGGNDETGASLVEYALLVALIAVVCILAVTFIGNSSKNKLSELGSNIGG